MYEIFTMDTVYHAFNVLSKFHMSQRNSKPTGVH